MYGKKMHYMLKPDNDTNLIYETAGTSVQIKF